MVVAELHAFHRRGFHSSRFSPAAFVIVAVAVDVAVAADAVADTVES